jgi:hypothetical protein
MAKLTLEEYGAQPVDHSNYQSLGKLGMAFMMQNMIWKRPDDKEPARIDTTPQVDLSPSAVALEGINQAMHYSHKQELIGALV